MTRPSVRWLTSPRHLRQMLEFVGRQTLVWGAVSVVLGLVIFALDLAFAFALERFLVAIGLTVAPLKVAVVGSVAVEATIFLVIGVLRVVALWAGTLTAGLCQVGFEVDRRRDIARWALHSDRAGLGDVMTLFSDVVVGAAGAVSGVFFLAGRVLLLVATLAALAYQSITVTTTLVLILMMVVPLHRRIDRRLNGVSSVIQGSLAQAVVRLLSGVKNAAFVHIHGLVGQEIRQVDGEVESYSRGFQRYYRMAATRAAVPQLIGLLVVGEVREQGGKGLRAFLHEMEEWHRWLGTSEDHRAVGRGITGVCTVAFLFLALRLFQNLSEVAGITAKTRVNGARLIALFAWWRDSFVASRAAIDRDLAERSAIERFTAPVGWRLENLSFAWTPTVPLVCGLDLEIPPGSATVILGPSGIGKTTLLLLLTGLVAPTGGTIRLLLPEGGVPLEASRERLLASTAYVGPDAFVVPGTLRDFLAVGVDTPPSERDLAEALRRSRCDFISALPLGLDHQLTEQGGGLSAGQKQRLALARALLRKPAVLLLDEATANLDVETERGIAMALEELKGAVTIVAVTHREALKAIADQLVVLDAAAVEAAAPASATP